MAGLGGLGALVSSLYLRNVQSNNVRYRQYPAAAAWVISADDAAYDELFVAATITTDYWLSRINYRGPDAGITADSEEVLASGTGGADGAAIAFATLLVETNVGATITTAAGESFVTPGALPIPIKIPALTRFADRISTSATGGVALGVAIEVAINVGA